MSRNNRHSSNIKSTHHLCGIHYVHVCPCDDGDDAVLTILNEIVTSSSKYFLRHGFSYWSSPQRPN